MVLLLKLGLVGNERMRDETKWKKGGLTGGGGWGGEWGEGGGKKQ